MHNNYNCNNLFENEGDFFFKRVKLLIGQLEGFFMEIKKVEISMKNPENYTNKSFAQVKKITTHIFQKRVLHW